MTATAAPPQAPAAGAAQNSDAAEASSAHSRINIPLNLENWGQLDAGVQEALLWFHQHLLDEKLDWTQATAALGYDKSVLFRVLKGTYEGSWGNILKAILSYKRIAIERAGIQRAKFAENSIARLIWAGLDYAVANNSITLVVGESGQGKTLACEMWREHNNHGRSVIVEIPPIGGTRAILRVLCEAVGINRNQSQEQMLEALIRAFNPNRILIVDEARRLLPAETRADCNPVKLELIRYIHDRTKCAVALIATQRFDDTLKKLSYQYEQVLGRIGQPVRLFRTIADKDFLPILQQYYSRPSDRLVAQVREIVNEQGRLRVLSELLKVATRIASKAGAKVTEEHFFKALALRRQMMGEVQHAAKGGAS
jgi:DNA transposition AAA+ family ATPase